MLEAVKLAETAVKNGEGGPFGAVIVKNGQIIAHGHNRVIKTNDPTAHAEVVTIREACRTLNTFDLTGCDLYVNCQPCPMCLAACYWANIEKIYYSNTKKDAEDIGFKDNFIYEELCSKVEDENNRLVRFEIPEAMETFKSWVQKPDKVNY